MILYIKVIIKLDKTDKYKQIVIVKDKIAATITVVRRFIEELSDSEVYWPGFFLNFFPSVSVKDFQNVLRLQRVITLRLSV